jgi:hypothetical protein
MSSMLPADKPVSDRRRFGRIRSQDVVTRFGEVMDISASGMRVMCNHHEPPAVGSIMHLELRHPQGSVEVKSHIMRVTESGKGWYELGIAFEDVSPTTSAGLLTVVRLAMQSIAVDYLQDQQQ